MESKLLVKKLRELTLLANDAVTAFERASVFAAINCIVREIEARSEDESIEPEFHGNELELVTICVNHVYSMIGYAEDNGHRMDQHLVWATTACNSLEGSLAKRKEW